jgi:predicted ATPase
VTIRITRFRDHWRHILERNYPVRCEQLRYRSLSSLHDDTIEFANGITAIVGGNGVGKSTLAHAAAEVLSGAEGVKALSNRSARLNGGEFYATGSSHGSTFKWRLDIDCEGLRSYEGSDPGEVNWLDPAELAVICQQKILSDSEFADLLEAVGSRSLSREDLELASYIVGKNYTSCDVWEVPDYVGLDVIPYFRVTVSGVIYGSETMGSGELSLLNCLWVLTRAAKDSVVVLEEPETHVSPRSQDALMNVVAYASDSRCLWVIVTTHSPVILRRLPLEHIRLLVSDESKSRLVRNPTWHQIGAILGGGIAYRGLLLVEDDCAKYFVQAVLDELQTDLRQQLSVAVVKGGISSIEHVLRHFPKESRWTLAAAFDGDARENMRTKTFEWPHIFLPGSTSPERLLASALASTDAVDRLAMELSKRKDEVLVARDAATGRDHHDWLNEMCRVLGPSNETVIRALVKIWISLNHDDAKTFVSELEQVFNNSRGVQL